jgi:dipeptidyl aminopeptidase/acylaminoacyl peptidase
MRSARFAFQLLILVTPFLAHAAPPIEEFTALPVYDNLSISPGGTHLALAQHQGSNSLLTIVNFPAMTPDKGISGGRETDVGNIDWVNEKTLLVEPFRLLGGIKPFKVGAGEVVRVDVGTGKTDLIFGQFADQKNTGSYAGKKQPTYKLGRVLTTRTDDPNEVMVETFGYQPGIETNGVYRLDIRNGKVDAVATSLIPDGRFMVGANHRVSVHYGQNAEGKQVVYYLPDRKSPGCCAWEERVTSDDEHGLFRPVAWSGKGNEFYALDGRDSPTTGIVMWDAQSNAQRLLYRNPDMNMYLAGTDSDGRPWVFAGSGDHSTFWYPDPDHPLARMHHTLVQGLPNDLVTVVSHTDDFSVAVVRIESPRRPPTYLVVDVKSAKPLQVMPTHPNLKAQDLAPVEHIEFAARDGLKIDGYLTTPRAADGKSGRTMPTVVVLHGGPYGIYDDFSYDFERQLFASRGYAVLQINFRGSGGRGREFERAGYRQWGRAMQDDVTDGVHWAVKNGVADANRICVYGASYGAYSALEGAVREPDMFKCAIGMSGVYDLPLMFDKGDVQEDRRGVKYLKDALGEDMADLRSRSPVYNAKAIKAKVLLIHGGDDVRAPLEHAKRMREALIAAGNPPEWILRGAEVHGFYNDADRVEAYSRMLEFLDHNIGH